MPDINNHSNTLRPSLRRRYWPILAELWIAATILAFAITRIFNSEFARNIFRSLAGC
jgi:hypothetical protein